MSSARRRTRTRAADGDSVRPRLGPGDELLQRLGRHVLRGDHGDVGQFIGERRRHQVALGIERHARVEILVDGEMPDRRAAQRVAVGCALGDGIDPDIARSPGPVLHHENLAEAFLEPFGQDAEQHVGRAAGGVGHDEPHRAIGPVGAGLRQGRGTGDGGGRGDAAKKATARDQAVFGHASFLRADALGTFVASSRPWAPHVKPRGHKVSRRHHQVRPNCVAVSVHRNAMPNSALRA